MNGTSVPEKQDVGERIVTIFITVTRRYGSAATGEHMVWAVRRGLIIEATNSSTVTVSSIVLRQTRTS